MRLRYTFPSTPKLQSLSMEVENPGDRLVFTVQGPRSLLYKQFFRIYFKTHSDLKRVAIREEGNVYTLYIPPIPSAAHALLFENFVRRWLYKIRIPLAVTIAVTDRCQCDCSHCSVPYHSKSEPTLTLHEIKRIVDECIDLGVTNITFTGGEPLLRSDLEECIRRVPGDKGVALVFTNGMELTAQRARSLKTAGTYGVQLSLDSPDPRIHDNGRRNAGAFEAVRAGVHNALEAGLLVGLSTYCSNRSVANRDLPRIVDLAARWGVHEVTAFDAMPSGQMLNRCNHILTKRSRKELLRQQRMLRDRYRGRIHVITQSWTNSNRGFARFIGCLAGNYQFHISAYGDIRPCDFTPVSFGNIRDGSVQDHWERLTTHPQYSSFSSGCRMQSRRFYHRIVEPLRKQGGGCLDASNVDW